MACVAGLRGFCASWLMGGIGAYPLVSGAGSCSSGVCTTLLIVWPEASQHWSLRAIGWGQVLASQWQPLGQLTPVSTLQYFFHQCSCPGREPQSYPTPQETLLDKQVDLALSPVKSLLLALGPGLCEILCALWECCLLPPVLWCFCDDAPLTFKAKCSEGSSSWCQIPRLVSLMWASESSLLWENFCDTVFQFVVHPPGGYVIWLYHNTHLLPSCCGGCFVFGSRISFLVGSSPFLSMVFQQLVLILMFFMRGGVLRSFYSNLSPGPQFY